MSIEISSVINVLKNELNAALGRKQELVELLSEADLTRAKDRLENFDDRIVTALSQYDPTPVSYTHLTLPTNYTV